MNAPLILKPSMSNHHPSDSISMDPILLYRVAPLILAVELEGLGLSEFARDLGIELMLDLTATSVMVLTRHNGEEAFTILRNGSH